MEVDAKPLRQKTVIALATRLSLDVERGLTIVISLLCRAGDG